MEGGKRGMLSRIAALELCDIDLDVYVLSKPSEPLADNPSSLLKKNCTVFQYQMRKAAGGMLFSKYPICSQKRYVSSMVKDLERRHYDAALYEGEQMMCYRDEGTVSADKHIIYLLDIESRYRRQMAASERNLLHKAAQALEGKKFEWFEKRMASLYDEFLFISIDELSELNEALNACVYSPYSVTSIVEDVVGDGNGPMLYVGDLSLENNYQSLYWFCEMVLPLIIAENDKAELKIIGRIDDRKRKEITSLGVSSNIRIEGYVDNLQQEYENASFVVSPVLYGAGVKAKVVDAMASGQLVVCTSKAIEGTRLVEGKHVMVSDSPEELADICLSILGNRGAYVDIACDGLEFIREEHSLRNHAALLAKCIGCSARNEKTDAHRNN